MPRWTMKVRDIMQTKLQAIGPDVPVLDAVTTMSEQHLSALPVLDPHGRIIGVISTTDVLQAEAEADDRKSRAALFETTVRELMTRQPYTIDAAEPVMAAAQQMLYLDVHRLFVEEEGKLVGVISQTDIVRSVAERQRLAEVQANREPVRHDGRRHRRPGKIQPRY